MYNETGLGSLIKLILVYKEQKHMYGNICVFNNRNRRNSVEYTVRFAKNVGKE